jgi:hypothetical protein
MTLRDASEKQKIQEHSSGKIPIFDCAVALFTMQNALLVISNLT